MGAGDAALKQTLGFQAEVKQLLHLMIHSLYGNKEGRSCRGEGPHVLETIAIQPDYVDDPTLPAGTIDDEIPSPERRAQDSAVLAASRTPFAARFARP